MERYRKGWRNEPAFSFPRLRNSHSRFSFAKAAARIFVRFVSPGKLIAATQLTNGAQNAVLLPRS
jgi:hypothetical protein